MSSEIPKHVIDSELDRLKVEVQGDNLAEGALLQTSDANENPTESGKPTDPRKEGEVQNTIDEADSLIEQSKSLREGAKTQLAGIQHELAGSEKTAEKAFPEAIDVETHTTAQELSREIAKGDETPASKYELNAIGAPPVGSSEDVARVKAELRERRPIDPESETGETDVAKAA